MPLRAFGPYNGVLPVPTGVIVGFFRDPATFPYLRYSQFIPVEDNATIFSYWRLDPDEAVRLPDLNMYAWAYDDYAPTGKGWQPQAELIPGRITRYAFPYTIGDATIQGWRRSGIDPMMLIDKIRMGHAQLHRATRVVNSLVGMSFGTQTGTPQSLLGTASPVYFDQSSGAESVGGVSNPNFQVIKRTLQRIKRRINLQTNGALNGEELIWVISPYLAEILSTSGEMWDALKQSQYATTLTDPVLRDWNLPSTYAGFKIVVEDTVRCYINVKDDGVTVADVTVAGQKDYILTGTNSYIVSRPGGLDSQFGGKNYSSVQIYTRNGEAQVKMFPLPQHELSEGRITTEDCIVTPVTISAFRLTGAVSP